MMPFFKRKNFKCNLIVDVSKGSQILMRFHLEHLCESLTSKMKKNRSEATRHKAM